jgi:hypothetical protein
MAKDNSRLLELLRAETFPLRHVHKFIGHNTAEFRSAVAELGKRFPKVMCEGFRESGTTHAYLAWTFIQTADCAEDIVAFMDATAALPGVKIIL